MEKIESIRKGSIWLNVFRTDDGRLLLTINKSYVNKDGEWNQTPFLNPRRGDLHDVVDCVTAFHEFEKIVKAAGAQR